MKSDDEIKLSYIPAQLRVRCQFSKRQTLMSPNPPPDLIERAKKRLNQDLENGHIAFYRFFKTRLEKIWTIMRDSDEPEDSLVAVTLGSGAPPMDGLIVEVDPVSSQAVLTITAKKEVVRSWRHFFLKLTVGKKLRDMKIGQVPNPAQIQRLWLRACSGLPVFKVPLNPLPEIPSQASMEANPFVLIEDEDQRDLTLVVYDIKSIEKNNRWFQLQHFLSSHAKIKKSKGKPGSYYLMHEEVIRTLRSAQRGPERFGIDLPVVILAGVDAEILDRFKINRDLLKGVDESIQQDAGKSKLEAPAVNPISLAEKPAFSDFVKLKVDDRGMVATIDWCDLKIYTHFKFSTIPVLMQKELRRLNIVYNADPSLWDHFLTSVRLKKNLDGMSLAVGLVPTPGSEPYYHSAYKDDQGTGTPFNERFHSGYVKKGQVIVETRFRNQATPGRDLFGNPVHAPSDALPPLVCHGEIESTEDGKYLALCDGVPKLQKGALTLDPILIIPGDVDLHSGHIDYEGDVLVKGDICRGSEVRVKGNLSVAKRISGGNIKVGGHLKVQDAIETGEGGKITCRGDIQCKFIQNSEILCQKNLSVETSILNSSVQVGGEILFKDANSKIFGGRLVVWGSLTVKDLGVERGSQTEVILGKPIHQAYRSHLLHQRWQMLTKHLHELEDERVRLQKPGSLTQRKAEARKQSIDKNIPRLKVIAKKLERIIHNLVKQTSFNFDSKLTVSGQLASFCLIEICGKNWTREKAFQGVRVYRKQERGIIIENYSRDAKSSSPLFCTIGFVLETHS